MYLFKYLWYQVKTCITWIYIVNYNTWYTVCIFIETKTADKYDILNIPDGFSYFAKNRKIFKHTSGGIVVVYRNNLKNHIKFKYLIMTFYWDVYTKTLYIRQ